MIAWVSSQGMRLLSIKQGHGLYLNHSFFQYSLHSIWRIPCGELIVCQMTKSKKKNNTFDQKGFQSVVKKDTERQTCWRTFPVMIKAFNAMQKHSHLSRCSLHGNLGRLSEDPAEKSSFFLVTLDQLIHTVSDCYIMIIMIMLQLKSSTDEYLWSHLFRQIIITAW